MVGQRMQHDRRILPRFHDLVEVADRAVAHGARQRPVDPYGVAAFERKRPTRSAVVRSSWQATVTSGGRDRAPSPRRSASFRSRSGL